MKMKITLGEDYYYTPNSAHRDNNPNKSQWDCSIKEKQECVICEESINNGWFTKNNNYYRSWGLNIDSNGKPQEIGHAQDGERLKVALFVENQKIWHGYPANLKNKQDTPLYRILIEWRNKGYTNKSRIKKLKRHKECTI